MSRLSRFTSIGQRPQGLGLSVPADLPVRTWIDAYQSLSLATPARWTSPEEKEVTQ